ncbi:MAG: class I SAM-dependent rRNA methyltransferase [Bacteroidetes bacterium]|nr:class I SAM-dependent rRNA methyltransferase [Bacteroidota bacterium]
MSNYPKIILKPGKERSLQRFHPWVFSGAIEAVTKELSDGEIVEVYDSSKKYLATGHYQEEGSITVRIFSFTQCEIDEDFWLQKFQRAVNLRKTLGLYENKSINAFRLIHGEGDLMPGLIMDYYDGNVVIQFHSYGMFLLKDTFVNVLKNVLGDKLKSIYNKSETTLSNAIEKEDLKGFLFQANKTEIIVNEYDNQYIVDIEEGQKTGFFIDQRENRKLLEKYCAGKKVLNVFAYTGGFSIAALKGGAELVHSVDSSQKATNLTNKNVMLNFGECDKHQAFAEDAFSFLDKMDNDYDVVVLDPPAFAKHLHLKEKGLKGYRSINNKVIHNIKKGGLLFTFSCSQAISSEDFRTMIFTAAAQAKREVKILHQLSQGADHPINIYHPESEYLKGLVLFVE